MRNLVNTYVERFRQDRQKQIRLAVILAALAVIVAGVVFWQLHNTGVAMTNEVFCGQEEHIHSEACYDGETLTCGIPEHTHTVECLIDETADVETADVWEDTLPVLSGIWSDDVASVAESQIGYTESTANYTLADDDETHMGYTRYGAWYGNEYGDWDAMFVSFCLNYAGVPESEIPENSGVYALATALDAEGLYVESSTGFTPDTGDLVFFDENDDGGADHVGIIVLIDEDELTVVEGNCEDAVAENVYRSDDDTILAFGLLPEQDLSAEAGMYTISYSGEIPGEVEIEGPVVAEVGTDQYFYVTVSGDYEITEITANGEELTAQEATEADDGESFICTYLLEDISGDTIVALDATQILKGSGSVAVSVYTGESGSGGNYTLTVEDVPTNTEISLNSPQITLTDENNEPVSGITLEGNLYYVENGQDFENGQPVSCLMLDDDIVIDEEVVGYVLTPYSENGDPYDMNNGQLFLYVPGDFDEVGTALIWQIQTNKLCYLDGDGDYQQELIEAVAAFNPVTVAIDIYSEGQIVELDQLTELMSENYYDEFYYGTVDPFNLTECTMGEIVGGKLLPLDESGNPVSGVSIYVVYDQVYSFDVVVNDVVNEHTEDNGDTYLWFGDTFYIDQYHAQGENELANYTKNGSNRGYRGIWPQLGNIREEWINNQGRLWTYYTEPSTRYTTGSVTYQDLLDGFEVEYGAVGSTSLNDFNENSVTGFANGNEELMAERMSHPYGIVGPYKTTESQPVESVVRITGHVGDEFTQTEAFGEETVYMITDQKLQEDWINLGSHASDNGQRGWFYWINDYYKLNNHQDEVEFVEIYENEDKEIRLRADEIGSSGDGEKDDIWEITGLYTKRNSVIKAYMLDNMDALEKEGVGFYEYAGWMHHIQLRTNTTVETVINGIVYNGTFQILYDDDTPSVEYSIKREATNLAGDDYSDYGDYLTGTLILGKDNDQETKQYTFTTADGVNFYVDPQYAEDPEAVSITVIVHATGTLNADNGGKIEYTEENPLIYTTTLSAEQLKEAADDCPNNEGYDVAINLADAIKTDNELSIMLYKVWDDDSNSRHSRDDVTYVTVSLERSKDGEEWEPVLDELGEEKAFTIRKGSDTGDTWSLTLHSSDLDLTYPVEVEEPGGEVVTEYREYYFRIAEEQDIVGVTNGFEYTYTIGEFSADEEVNRSLIVMNSLNYTINISGEKVWYDGDTVDENGDPVPLDPDDTRIPDSLTIGIFQNGEFYAMTTAEKGSDWLFSFDGLPQAVYNGEDVYEYTLYELDEDGNRVTDDGFILIDGLLYHVGMKQTDPPEGSEDPDVYYVQLSNAVYTAELPNTGGTGTWIFAVIGVCLFGGAAGTLVYRKRRAVRS